MSILPVRKHRPSAVKVRDSVRPKVQVVSGLEIDNMDPPHIPLPGSVFWSFVFPALDQRGFGRLAVTCHQWYRLIWERDLWAKMPYVAFTDKGLRSLRSSDRGRFLWDKLLFHLGLGNERLKSRMIKLLEDERFSLVRAAKITSPLGSSHRDNVPPCLHSLLSRMPLLESLNIGGKAGSVLFWSQCRVFSELIDHGPNLKEILIPSYPPRGIRTLIRRHPSLHTLHLHNLVGPCVYGEWSSVFRSRHLRNRQLRVLTLIDQGAVTTSHLKWVSEVTTSSQHMFSSWLYMYLKSTFTESQYLFRYSTIDLNPCPLIWK